MINYLKNKAKASTTLACVLALIALALPLASEAQVTTGVVTGTVSDPSGAVVAGAEVRLINTRTGLVQRTATASAGDYQFLLVPPGLYAVEVEAAGFKIFRREGIVVEANRSLAVPVTLEVGAVSERIEVSGGTPLLEPNTSTLGTVMDQRKIEDLPLNGRNPMALANLIPTVQGIGYFGGSLLSTWRMGQVVIGGGTPLNNAFLIDGIANEKMTDYSAMAFLPVDATQEFKVLTNAMSAEFGRTGGGVISMISRSGTNQFHGSLFEYLRNDKLNSNEFFANKAGSPRPALRVNTFGGTLGGPIKQDKLFFFFNYEGYRERRYASRTINSPTAEQRAGDFSDTRAANGQLIVVYDPFTTRADPARPGTYLRDPFPSNRIPAQRISPIATAVLKYYPMPNLPGLPYTRAQNLFLLARAPVEKDNLGIRIDYNLTAARRLAGRFSRDVLDWGFPNYFNNIADTDGRLIKIPRRTAVLEYTDTLAPTLLLNARLGVNREQEQTRAPGRGFDVTSIGFSSLYARQIQYGQLGVGFPAFSITDFTSFGRPDSTGNPSATGTAAASVTKIQGRHNIKFGFDQRLYRRSDWGTSNSSGNFSFGRSFTQGPNPLTASATAGNGLATFLLGTPTSGTAGVTSDTTVSMNHSALFIQEDWKVSGKLTLNLGLRWEYEGPVKERRNIFPNFDPAIASPLKVPGLSDLRGGLVFPGTGGLPKGLTDRSLNDFGPRFGFAYQLDARTVFRGGYGISYIPTFGPGGTAAGAGFAVNTPMVTSIDGGLTPYNTLANPFPNGLDQPTGSRLGALTGVGGAVTGQLRGVHRGYSQQWNFTVQREPWANWLVEAAWVGNHGSRLTMSGQPLNWLDNRYLAWGTQLLQQAPNPFYGIITSGPVATSTLTVRQLLLPFPQFSSVSGGSVYRGNSIYHALTLKVEKRFSQGFSLLAAYAAAKLIDDLQGTGRPGAVSGAAVQDWQNLRAERSRSYQDIPQRLVVTALWEIPYRPDNRLLRGIAGGWQVNGISTIHSGRSIPLSASISNGGNRPNVVPGVSSRPSNQSLSQWFNTAAFSQPPAFTYGNVSRTLPDIHGPRFYNLDASLFKTFAFTEQVKLQFRAEAFNLTNTPSFEVPDGRLNSTTFGMVTATTTPARTREMQMALRLTF